MKKLYNTLLILMAVSAVMTAVFLIFLPDIIPADFILDGTIARFGSKFEYILFPFFAVMIGALAFITKAFKRKNARVAKAIVITAICIVGLITLYVFCTLLNIAILEFGGF